MGLLFIKSGILTTVQDLGRTRFRRFGVNPAGAMDQAAARLINLLIGNDESNAVIEMHCPAPEIVFETPAVAAIGGASFSPALDGTPLENWRAFSAKPGSVLRFGNKISGNRAYLAIQGGIKADIWLESSSTSLTAGIGGYKGKRLESGARIEFSNAPDVQRRLLKPRIAPSLIPRYSPFPTVRIIPGAEFNYLEPEDRHLLETENFTISNNSDRMGFRLAGRPIGFSRPLEIVSSAVTFGTVQLLPDGQLIVLMADHQTAGGYPRIAHVVTPDLPLMAQLGTNDKVAFHLIDISRAEALAVEFERELNFFRVGCKFQTNS